MNRRATLRAPLAVRAGGGGGSLAVGEEWVGWRGAEGNEMAHEKGKGMAGVGNRSVPA